MISFEKRLKSFRFIVGNEQHIRIAEKVREVNRAKKVLESKDSASRFTAPLKKKIAGLENDVIKMIDYAESK